jgi:hypothetical protein
VLTAPDRRPRSPFRRGKIFGDVVQSTGFKVDEEAQDVTIQPKKEAPVTGGAPSAENSKNTLVAEGQQGKPRERMLAELGLSAILANTSTARSFAKAAFGELDLTESVGVMREKARAVQAGNLAGLEETLTAQAVALDAIFNEMARRAALNMGEYINTTETYLRLGLKAQAQCRATLQTLFEMKNPQPVAFVKQANIANGPQQVNNGVTTQSPPHAEISANPSNELLGLSHDQRLDTGTAGSAGGAHSRLETVGAVVRTED